MAETLKFDHYDVLLREDGSFQELGRGAMGVTYKAFDSNLRIPVALKVINAASINSELARQRFVREARAAAALRHANVASVFHLGIEGDSYFYAMEYVDGETIESLIRRSGPVAPILAIQIVIQVARALNAASKLELVHRDIKPANLMVINQDEELVVKVIDFGLAKSSKADGEDLATVSMGGFVGTPHFASPEQLEEKDLDVRSDIYSLGITLWYMLAGRTPFGGSLAQVMSQHLSKLPPFEQLNLPSPVVYLLKRMLAKEPADRFQTPLELRREAEKCIESLKEAETVVAPAGIREEDADAMATLAADNFATIAAEPLANPFKAGARIANRYELVEKLDVSTWLARIKGGPDHVQLVLLRKDLSREAKERIETLARKAVGSSHPNLLRYYGLDECEGTKFVAREAIAGCSLLDVLRARRQLTPQEVALLLGQAAEAGDFWQAESATGTVDLSLASVALAVSGQPEGLMKLPLDQWPSFTLKLNPLPLEAECVASETWSGQRTVISSQSDTASAAGLVRGLGLMVYELLGGNPQQIPAGGRYVPLAVLSEKGNSVLKQALEPSSGFGSGKEFLSAFITEVPKQVPQTHSPVAADVAIQPIPSAAIAQGREAAGLGKIWLVAAGCTTLAGMVLAFLLFRSPAKIPEISKSSVAKPEQVKAVEATPPPAVVVATPAPTPIIQPTPKPTPTQQEILRARLDSVKPFESAMDWGRCLHEYVQIEKEFPESDAARVELELIIPKLAAQIGKSGGVKFEEVREDLTRAAHAGVVSAMMLLGHSLQKTESALAFSWFQSAAEKGYAPAMIQAGLMYSSGLGVGCDFKKAFALFQQAADKGDAVAKTFLGECFLYGKGTPQDQKKAVATLREAADANEPRGMNLLGDCYHKGIGTEKDFKAALQLFKKAGEQGLPDGFVNEGILYLNGEGVESNPHQAVELFQKGADAGNAYAMLLLGYCYETGSGVEESRTDSVNWYRKSARGGNTGAMEWCRKNQVDFSAR